MKKGCECQKGREDAFLSTHTHVDASKDKILLRHSPPVLRERENTTDTRVRSDVSESKHVCFPSQQLIALPEDKRRRQARTL